MGDFLKGWRRKTGLCLLVMAMPLTMAWLRSFNVATVMTFHLGGRGDYLESVDGTLSWMRGNQPYYFRTRRTYSHTIGERDRVDRWIEFDFDRRGTWMGFEFGVTSRHEPWSPNYYEVWVIPYWSIVLPLTLLSAYLLLTKPRSVTTPVLSQDTSPLPEQRPSHR